MNKNGAHSVLSFSLFSLFWKFEVGRAVACKAATFFSFCKSICLNTFRLKGKNVSAFQGKRPPWVRLAVYAQSVAVCVRVRACVSMCALVCMLTYHLPICQVSL